jgi:O-antigen ligase
MALLQAVSTGLIALILTPGLLFYFDVTPKVVAFLVSTAILLVWHASSSGARLPRVFSAGLLLAAISLGLSTVFSANPALSLFGTNWRRFGAVVQASVLLFAWIMAQSLAGRRERIRIILRGIGVATFLMAMYGIAQYWGWDPILPASAYHIGEGLWTIVRPPGTLGYVSYFATWLLMASFLSLALAEEEPARGWRWFAWATAAIALIAMVLTGTRAAILGLALGAAVSVWGRGFRVSRRIAAAGFVVLLAGAAFYFSPMGWQMHSRARWFAEDPWGGARPLLWRDSLRMGLKRPVAGYGPEVFTAAFPRFESKDLAKAYPDFAHESPHNIFLDALVGQGLPGLIALALMSIAGLWAAWRAQRLWLVAAIAAGILSQQFTVFTVPTAMIFYATIALAVGAVAQSVERHYKTAWLVAAALTAAALGLIAVRVTVADHALADAKHAIDAGNAAASIQHYAIYDRWRLPGTAADLWYSRALLDAARKTPDPRMRVVVLAQAGTAGLRATRTAEDPFNAWYTVAMLYAVQNNAEGAEKSLRSASAAHPNWFKPHWTLAQLLHMQNRMEEAHAEAALAAELDGGKHNEVRRTMEEIDAQRVSVRSVPLHW